MDPTPDLCYALMQTSVFVLFALMVRSALRQGRQWFVVLIYGAIFGFIVEYAITAGSNPAYMYATDHFWCIGKAPIWVALGWGMVAYACTRTAQKMQFSDSVVHDLVWRPFVAGYLAVGIDLTLDPVAHALGFWIWQCDCILLGGSTCQVPCPVAPTADPVLRFFEVPFDNFIGGWFGIIWTYSLSVFALSVAWRRFFHRTGERAPHVLFHDEETLFDDDGHWNTERVLFALIGPAIALVFVGLFFWFVVRSHAAEFYKQHQHDGALRLCIAVFLLGAFATAFASLMTRRNSKIDGGIVGIACFFHLAPFLLLAFFAYPKAPELYLVTPANLAFSLLLFTWPFQDTLIENVRTFVVTWTMKIRTEFNRLFGSTTGGEPAPPDAAPVQRPPALPFREPDTLGTWFR